MNVPTGVFIHVLPVCTYWFHKYFTQKNTESNILTTALEILFITYRRIIIPLYDEYSVYVSGKQSCVRGYVTSAARGMRGHGLTLSFIDLGYNTWL